MNLKSKVNLVLIILFSLIVLSCETQKNEEMTTESNINKNTFYQYNIWWGFVNKVFEGDLTVKELKTKGDLALGSYTQLDGELIMLDGIPYRVRENGEVSIPDDNDKIVYVDAAFFEPDSVFDLNEAVNFETLRTILNEKLPTLNQFYCFRIDGDFSYVKCGGLNKQERPYKEGLDVLIPKRPIYERADFKGTIVGFFCPDFIGNINAAGYHFHFISEDKKFGGHLMAFESKKLNVEVDPLLNYEFTLPGSEDFFNVSMEKEFQYGTK